MVVTISPKTPEILAMEPKFQVERTTLRGTFGWPLWVTTCDVKALREKGYFFLKNGYISFIFWVHQTWKTRRTNTFNSYIVKITPKKLDTKSSKKWHPIGNKIPLHVTLFGSYLIFAIFLHGQNFWRIKFTPKNANFSR